MAGLYRPPQGGLSPAQVARLIAEENTRRLIRLGNEALRCTPMSLNPSIILTSASSVAFTLIHAVRRAPKDITTWRSDSWQWAEPLRIHGVSVQQALELPWSLVG